MSQQAWILCRRIGDILRVSYICGYQCMAYSRCPHDICACNVYCNVLCFLRYPSLILVLNIRRALFSGSKAGKGSRNKVHMFLIYQDQFLLPRNGPSNLILDCVWQIYNSLSRTCPNIAQCTIWNRIALLHPCLVIQQCHLFFRTILHFFNFCTISHWSLQTLFVCFILFSSDQSILLDILLISYSMQVLRNPQQPIPILRISGYLQ